MGGQLRANVESWDEFTADHFAFPPFTLLGGQPEAVRVFGGVDALEFRLDSLNGAVFASADNNIAPTDTMASALS